MPFLRFKRHWSAMFFGRVIRREALAVHRIDTLVVFLKKAKKDEEDGHICNWQKFYFAA